MRRKYLAQYAEPEVARADSIEGEWEHVVVVPACGEPRGALDGLAAACAERSVLAVLVVNARADHDASVHALNEQLLMHHAAGAHEVAPGMWLRRGEPDVLVVDRASENRRFGALDGVGLARKVGCDVALALSERVRSPWIHLTDADAHLPADHFDACPDAGRGAAAFVHRFEHVPSGDPAVDDAHRRYELSLRYYVLGLRWAGSPYAFHTIGSVIGVDGDAYAGVRGVPRRQAGEDFYLLNKLAKLGPVVSLAHTPVRILSRVSGRVPFGTGPAVRRLLDQPEGPEVYAPESFVALRAWSRVLSEAATGPWEEWALEALAPDVRAALERALDHLGARAALKDLHARHAGPSRPRQLHGWFDAFRTLKLIHGLREAGLRDRPWREAFARAKFLEGLDPDGEVEHLRTALAARELEP